MLDLIENLPVDLVGTNVLGYLSLKDIVLMERACGSKKSHQLFRSIIIYCPAIKYPHHKRGLALSLHWFEKTLCPISSLTIALPVDNPCLHVKNFKVDYFDLEIAENITIESMIPLLEHPKAWTVRNILINGDQISEVMEQLSVCTGNVEKLDLRYSENWMDWLTAKILSRWKLKEIDIISFEVATSFMVLIAKTCTELTSIKLCSSINDAAAIVIAQHCSKLERLQLMVSNITWTSLLALSKRRLPLKELYIVSIPNIPTVDIARRCSHALSCIRHIRTDNLHQNGQDATILIPYMTGLTSLYIESNFHSYIPLLTQHCHKLSRIYVLSNSYSVADILPLCRTNLLLQKFYIYGRCDLTDTMLIELIHACPHLHTLCLPYVTTITDISILALSEHCTQLQCLEIKNSTQVTEVAVLQLLQSCRKLTRLDVSISSLSEETWTQLDKNTQTRVSRW